MLICIGIAACLSLLTKLSHTYMGEITATVHVANLPKEKVLAAPFEQHLKLTVKTTGFKLLMHSLRNRETQLTLDFSDVDKATHILTNDFKPQIVNELSSDYNLVDIHPDTLRIHFVQKLTKKVPVRPNYEITFSKQFDYAEPMLIKPDSVTISGPDVIVRGINQWKTEKYVAKGLKKSVETFVPLKAPENETVSIQPKKVRFIIPVEEFTEGTAKIAINVINVPQGMEVSIYPKYVNAVFRVGLSNYTSVDESLFRAVVDFSKVDVGSTQYADVEIIQAPRYINNLSFTPKSVEYIIYN